VTVASPVSRVLSFLRSRRLAIGLLLFVTGYSFVGTIVPQMAREPEKVAAWATKYAAIEPVVGMLGLHSAFSAPVFLAAMGLLFLSTSACAWERTRTSARMLARRRGLSESDVRRLSDHPQLRVPAPGLDAQAAGDAVRSALVRLRLDVRAGKRASEAIGGRWGLAGSPLFHISLAALFLVIGLGQLTRAEGLIGIPVGYPVPDAVESYGRWEAGPLYAGVASGLAFGASDFQLETVIDGVDRGASAVIMLSDSSQVLRSQRVYPNNPLRFGSMMVHQNDYGLAVPIEIEDATGTVLAEAQPLVDFAEDQPSGTTTSELRMTTPAGGDHVVEVTVPADRGPDGVYRDLPKDRRARVKVTTLGAATIDETLDPGQSVTLPDGNLLRLKDVVYYTRLSVVDDWSVYPIYGLFVLAGAGVTLAVFVPYRVVRVLLVEAEGGLAVHVVTRHARRDPLFAESVEEALREALGAATAAPPATVSAPPDAPAVAATNTDAEKGL
jgi:cytochrome c biogenesis protein ResB